MRTIKYTNASGGSVVFPTDARILAGEIEGLDGLSVDLVTTQFFRQHGATHRYSQLTQRDITIPFAIDELTADNFSRTRARLLGVFLPLGKGRLEIHDESFDVYCDVYVQTAPTIPTWAGATCAEGEVTLTAPDPILWDIEKSSCTLETWTGGWSLPWSGRFSLRTPGTTAKTVTNTGQLPVPITVTFLGPCTRPRVTNVSTGEYIQIDETITSAETLTITTGQHDKSAVITGAGTSRSGESLLSDGSTFFQLEVGDNKLAYSTAGDTPGGVSVSFRRGYYGI